MITSLRNVLKIADKGGFAIPAFNVYNMETVMGVAHAAEKLRAPIIMQIYSRLFDGENGKYVAANIRRVIEDVSVPVAFHLDHGASKTEVIRALYAGATGIMIDASTKSFDENVAITRDIVETCGYVDIAVEGELGHVGTTKDEKEETYTEVADAVEFVKQTGVEALAVAVGTAHGRYKKAPVLAISRIAELATATKLPIVLHGGSGTPDDQVRAAVKAGIRKVNFSTDLCYAFLDTVFATSRDFIGIDLFMRDAIDSVEKFATEKIKLLGAEGRV